MIEPVEVCPICEAENTFPGWDVEENGYVAVCHKCGSEMMLCDECTHAEDNPSGRCDWHEENGESVCFRGRHKWPKEVRP